MSVGDLVGPSRRIAAPSLIRFRAELANRSAAVNDYAADRLFTNVPARPSRLSRIARAIPGLGARMSGAGPASLVSLLDTHHDVFSYGTRSGVESVAVPFGHLVLISGTFHGVRGKAAEDQIKEVVARYFGRYVDDITGIQVLCRDAGGAREDEILLYFGRGVFVPRNGEQPVGHVTIGNGGSDVSAQDQVVLPSNAPAGIYRGQAGLAFGLNWQAAHAVTDVFSSDDDCFFDLGPSADIGGAVDLTWHPGGRSDSCSYLIRTETPQPGTDATFSIRDDAGRELILTCTRDARPSRLHRSPPPGDGVLEITGLVAPMDQDGSVHRWWVDVDREDRLLGGAMATRSASILCEGTEVSRYDWREYSFVKGAKAHRVVDAKAGADDIRILFASEGTPFGYLAAPEKSQAAVFQDRWWTREGFWLDWLDFSGGVETWSGITSGLATDAAQRWPSARIPGHRADPGTAQSGILTRSRGARAFSATWHGEWEPGTEFIAGPLVLRIPPE